MQHTCNLIPDQELNKTILCANLYGSYKERAEEGVGFLVMGQL